MNEIPNARHSQLLSQFTKNLDILDPFRHTYPDRKEYTYIPREVGRINPSRIDFFLISRDLLTECSDSIIEKNLQSKLFDPKAIIATFNKPWQAKSINNKISNKILSDPDIDIVVPLEVDATYLTYTSILIEEHKDYLLEKIGWAKQRLKSVGPDSSVAFGLERDQEEELRCAGEISAIKEIIDEIDFKSLFEGALAIEDDLFMETLINNVRNEVVSYQVFINKVEKKSINELKQKLETVLNAIPFDYKEHQRLELLLNLKTDLLLRKELESFANFDVINHERITPIFVKLVKGSKNFAKLTDIENDNGQPFETVMESKKFIHDYYTSLYKADPEKDINIEGCIEHFLGDEILNNEVVKNSKLTQDETDSLELSLTIEELDDSVKCANKSACGIDGISNCFIKKFWQYLRNALHRYAECCFRKKNSLPASALQQ